MTQECMATSQTDVDQDLVVSPETLEGRGDLRARLGGKAASLYELMGWGLPVPEWCCVTTTAFEHTLRANGLATVAEWLHTPSQPLPMPLETLREAILGCALPAGIAQGVQRFLQRFPEAHFAVRSSGTLEDGAQASFAGLYVTLLNVRRYEDVCDALRTCWAALFEERVRRYLQDRHISGAMGLALVVQRLIPAQKSGVLFSVDPVRGCDTEVLVEACFGLGEALVAGQVTPDRYRYDWFAGQVLERTVAHKEVHCVRLPAAPFTRLEPLDAQRAGQAVLSEAEVSELVELALRAQENAGYPVDVEWAKVGEQFYLLQSRPITQLGHGGIPGQWTTADFRDGGVSATVCTPYMASLYKSVFDVTMPAYLSRIGLPSGGDQGAWQQSFFGRPYWNLQSVKRRLSHIPGFKERVFDEGLGIVPGYPGDGLVTRTTPRTLLTAVRVLVALKASCRRQLKDNPGFVEAQQRRLQELGALDLASLSSEALFAFAEQFLGQEYFRSESTYFNFIYDNSNLNNLFQEAVAKVDFPAADFPLLLSGLTGVSHLAPIESLWVLRQEIKADAESLRYWQQHSADAIAEALAAGERRFFLDRFADYLKRYGHHAKQELDLMVPRYLEDPRPVIANWQEALGQPDDFDPRLRNQDQQRHFQAARGRFLAALPFWKRRGMAARLEQVRAFLWWREELRDLSTHYYYHVRRVTLAVAQRWVEQGVLRQPDEVFFLELDDLLRLLRGQLPTADVTALVARNRRYYRSFARYTIPDELGAGFSTGSGPAASGDPGGERFAVAGSPGIASGTARVIANIDDADRLQPGDILVTRCTDPGWTHKFAQLSGVVTETGGVLSHAAVICREYGMPAVLAVQKATLLIRDGEFISIDGGTGAITLGTGASQISLAQRRQALYPVAVAGGDA
ncbi:MAG: PEP/pyruvate-binding domain-containing protein [Pseudomonas sp.]|uniref:PEP/pyruvate-binding domain-containing protein n=1 Tax=Pseudomonas sp. TaxID=306 RepID=UPI00339B78C7